jgi:molecular chaperone DnaJ
VDSPCKKCYGDGRFNDETTIKIDVPAGVEEGNYMTMRNEGNAGKRGGPNGDIIIVFQELKHQQFVRNADDIVYDLFINFPQAALGAEVEVPTLTGKAMLKIDSGTQPGKVLRMRGKGIKHLQSSGTGDQLVRVNVAVPKKLNSKEKELLKQLGKLPNISSLPNDEERSFFSKFGL